jgi:HK97 family phage major capsid protein
MEFPELKTAIEELNAARKELRDVLDEAKNDAGEYDVKQLKSLKLPDGVALREFVQEKNAKIESLQDKVTGLKDLAAAVDHAAAEDAVYEDGDGTRPSPKSRQTLGKAFAESAAFKDFHGGTGPVSHLDLDIRNTLFEKGAGWAPESTRTGYVDLSPEPRLSVLDFVPQIPTSQSSVKFMRETTFDDSNVAEKAEGAQYGEAALALTEISLPIEKVPAFLPVTDEQLEDVEQAEEYVNSRLVYMIRKRTNNQILAGDGVTPNLEGTENVTGIQTQALGADPIPDAIYKLMVKIMDDADNSGGDADPDVVFIRPTKWQSVRLLRTADGIYIWGNPSEAGPQRIWGVPVVLTNGVTATKAVVGDYRTHSYLAIKRGVDVQVSNSHSDFFIKGKLAVRADVRVAMVHLRPAAFGEVTGL